MEKNQYCQSGLNPETTCKVIEGLNIYLANLGVLHIKLHNIHWNVVDEGFFALHAKTQELYERVAAELDKTAERIKMLGEYPLASLQDYLDAASIEELPSDDISSRCAAQIIVEDFCRMLKLVRKLDCIAKETLDECTVSLLAEAMCFFEKNIWFFNAYLTKCPK